MALAWTEPLTVFLSARQLRQAWYRDRSDRFPGPSLTEANEPDVLRRGSEIHTLGRNDTRHHGYCLHLANARWTAICREGIKRHGENTGQTVYKAQRYVSLELA